MFTRSHNWNSGGWRAYALQGLGRRCGGSAEIQSGVASAASRRCESGSALSRMWNGGMSANWPSRLTDSAPRPVPEGRAFETLNPTLPRKRLNGIRVLRSCKRMQGPQTASSRPTPVLVTSAPPFAYAIIGHGGRDALHLSLGPVAVCPSVQAAVVGRRAGAARPSAWRCRSLLCRRRRVPSCATAVPSRAVPLGGRPFGCEPSLNVPAPGGAEHELTERAHATRPTAKATGLSDGPKRTSVPKRPSREGAGGAR